MAIMLLQDLQSALVRLETDWERAPDRTAAAGELDRLETAARTLGADGESSLAVIAVLRGRIQGS